MECHGPASESGVRIDAVGTLDPGAPTKEIAEALCPRLAEVADCVSIVHGNAKELHGTIDVVLDLGTTRSLKPVVVVGGTLPKDQFGACVTDALEVTGGTFPHAVQLTLAIVARDVPRAAPTKSDDALGRLALEVIKRLIRAHFPRFRSCYEDRLASTPELAGEVGVRFIIDETGAVSSADIEEAATTIADPTLRACVRDGYRKIRFPRPKGGKVMVAYPISFENRE